MLIRLLLLPLAAFLLTAATAKPVEDQARELLVAKRDAEAFALIERAAAGNNPKAIDFLGWFYDQGRFVSSDLAKAEVLYRRAAALGVAHAQWRLGVMIDDGQTRQGTLEDAVLLFRQAAAQNFSNAYVSLGVMQSGGRGTPQDYGAALKNYLTAARMKNVHAFNEIGVVYLMGEGVKADPIEAGAWFVVSAAYNDPVAGKHLGKVLDRIGEDKLPAIVERANRLGREYGLLDRPIEAPRTA